VVPDTHPYNGATNKQWNCGWAFLVTELENSFAAQQLHDECWYLKGLLDQEHRMGIRLGKIPFGGQQIS